MAGTLLSFPRIAPLNDGAVVPGGKIYAFLSGTTTAAATYTAPDLVTPHAHPVVSDAEGSFAPIYLDPANGLYRIRWTDASDVQIRQDDNVPSGVSSALDSFAIEGAAPYYLLTENDASANNGNWRWIASGEQLLLQVGNDALSSWVDVLAVDRTLNVADSIQLLAPAVYSDSGSFTATLTGVVSGSGTINYIRIGGLVHLYASSSFTGTSNATSLAFTGLPAAIQTTGTRRAYCPVLDNGNEFQGQCIFSSGSGTVILRIAWASATPAGVFPATSNFTGSGSKGLPIGWSVTYHL
jgi:hypothetical protein